MLDKFFNKSLKVKKQILIASGIVLLILIYQLAISPTLEVVSLNQKYTQNIKSNVSVKEVSNLEVQLENLNKRLNSEVGDSEFLRKELLNFIALEVKKNKLNLISIPEVSSDEVDDFDLIINKFEIEGAFENLNKLLYALETNQTFGKVVNVTFKKVKNRVNKRDQLILSVYIQSIIFKKL